MSEPVPPLTPDLADVWRSEANSVFPERAAVLHANGWAPQDAKRVVDSLTGDFTTMPLLLAANDLAVAASHITTAVPQVSIATALLCAQAGLDAAEVAALHARNGLDRATLASMAALRA